MEDQQDNAVAVFGGGCFWCTEALFSRLRGVISVTPGYAGGTTEDPTYEEVCTGTTGHAEVVKITFDPDDISYNDLLTVFFATHDPTTRNRQGNDVGPQYRSLILYTTDEQRNQAEEFIATINAQLDDPVVTEVESLNTFYAAEEEHHNYYQKNTNQSYCQVVIAPKIEKLQKRFKELLAQS